MTYIILNLVFMLTLIFFIGASKKVAKKPWLTALVIVAGLTLLFDPVIIALGIVGYNDSLILGLRWFGAPVEDLFYAVYVACAIPLVWHTLEAKDEK